MDQKLNEHVAQLVNDCLPGNSIDCVILGYENQQLKTLLLQWKKRDVWSLPGGFILKEEDIDQAAHRILEERTGLKSIFLNQFYTFGSRERSQMNGVLQAKRTEEMLRELEIDNLNFVHWIQGRFITTGYFALTDIRKTDPQPDFLSEKCEWKALDDLPELILDHGQIIEKALEHLRIQLNYLPIGLSLLPEKFTMQDIQKLYEAILQKKLERSNFQRKMLSLGIFIRLEKQLTGAANKAPYLYRFDKAKYNELVSKGIGFSY
jgi:ADP-ribose pyrophosphatase YjhB (NUDIX family)